MKTSTLLRTLLIVCTAVSLSGCTSVGPSARVPFESSVEPLAKDSPPATTSLFPSDQAVLSDEAVARALSSTLALPSHAKVALLKFKDTGGPRYYGRYYWRDEEYLKLEHSQVEALSQTLQSSDDVREVSPLPSLLTPDRMSIPTLREAAVRMRADLLLVFRVGSDTYSQYRTLSKDKVKSYSTCECVLLDVRTGLVPFTRVVSREQLEVKQAGDLDLSETMRRAEQTSAAAALKAAAQDLVAFIKSVPKKDP